MSLNKDPRDSNDISPGYTAEMKEQKKPLLDKPVPESKDIAISAKQFFMFADGTDKALLTVGIIGAFLMGSALPSFGFLFGEVTDSFTGDPQELLEKIEFISLVFLILGVGVWITSYLYFGFFIILSERTAMKFRVAYLNALLK